MKCIYKIKWVAVFALAVFFIACNSGNEKATVMYTCPMPQDSVFSDKPGKCPKCGMDLVLMENHSMHSGHDIYLPYASTGAKRYSRNLPHLWNATGKSKITQ